MAETMGTITVHLTAAEVRALLAAEPLPSNDIQWIPARDKLLNALEGSDA